MPPFPVLVFVIKKVAVCGSLLLYHSLDLIPFIGIARTPFPLGRSRETLPRTMVKLASAYFEKVDYFSFRLGLCSDCSSSTAGFTRRYRLKVLH